MAEQRPFDFTRRPIRSPKFSTFRAPGFSSSPSSGNPLSGVSSPSASPSSTQPVFGQSRESTSQRGITGPDDFEENPDKEPGFGVPTQEATFENFVNAGKNIAGILAPGIGTLGLFSSNVLGQEFPDFEFSLPSFADFLGSRDEKEIDFFDFDPSVGPEPSPDEFADFDTPGVAFSSLGLGETDFGTGFSSRDIGGLEEGTAPGATAANDAAVAQATDESFNPGTPSPGSVAGGGFGEDAGDTDAADGGSVICNELYRMGFMPYTIWKADQEFAQLVNLRIIAGYHLWAKPAVRWMQRSERAVWLARTIAMPWAYHMAFTMGVRDRDNKTGKWIMKIGLPICQFIGTSAPLLVRFRNRFYLLPPCIPGA